MFKYFLIWISIFASWRLDAQPWIRNLDIGSSSNQATWRKMIATYDGGIAMLITTLNSVYLLKLDKDGKELQRKMLVTDHPASSYFYCNGLAEDIDHGLIITGVVDDSQRSKAVRIKLDPCYQMDYLVVLQDEMDVLGTGDAVTFKDLIIEAVLQEGSSALSMPLAVNTVDRGLNSIVKKESLLGENNPTIANIRKVKDGFALVGSGDFFYPPPENTRWLRSYLLYFDSTSTLVGRHVSHDSTLQFSSGKDIEYYDGHFYLLNLLRDSARENKSFYPEIVKLTPDLKVAGKIPIRPDTLARAGHYMKRIGDQLFICGEYYPDVRNDRYDSRAVICRYDITANEYSTLVVDSFHNQAGNGGLIKTSDDKLIFMYIRQTGGNPNPGIVLYQYRPDLTPDSFMNETVAYNWDCSEAMNISQLTLATDTFMHTGYREFSDPRLSFSIHPNPANGELIISYQEMSGKEYRLKLYGSDGRFIFEKALRNPREIIDISVFKPGVYHLVVEDISRGVVHLQQLLKN